MTDAIDTTHARGTNCIKTMEAVETILVQVCTHCQISLLFALVETMLSFCRVETFRISILHEFTTSEKSGKKKKKNLQHA